MKRPAEARAGQFRSPRAPIGAPLPLAKHQRGSQGGMRYEQAFALLKTHWLRAYPAHDRQGERGSHLGFGFVSQDQARAPLALPDHDGSLK